MIVEGKAVVTRDGTEIAVLGPGAFFGEMSLLDGQPRAATVTTTERTRALVLTTAAFNGVLTTMPSVDRKMLVVLAAASGTSKRSTSQPTSVMRAAKSVDQNVDIATVMRTRPRRVQGT